MNAKAKLMTDLERFLAVVNFSEPDYVPIFGFPGAPGMSLGLQAPYHRRLVDGGMPALIGGRYTMDGLQDADSWMRYWGTTTPLVPDFSLAQGIQGVGCTKRLEDGYEILEYECGTLIRQVIDNDIIYTMPEFIRYTVRDRASWEFWRDRMTPQAMLSSEEMEGYCRRYDHRTRPLELGAWGPYGFIRSLMGPEAVSLAFYDDPELVHDMLEWTLEYVKTYTFPLIARLKPEIMGFGEDLCYNHGMLLSPATFREFCGHYYRVICDFAKECGVPLITIDTDGNAMEFVDVITEYGVNSIHPFEVKAGNDLFALRRKHPRFVCFGWLEKEVVNEGNEALIEPEILAKVPPLLAQGGYFPNGDHGIQPDVTFHGLCRFMTLLHEVCGNPEGEFPRIA